MQQKPHSPILDRSHKFARGLQFACPFAWGGLTDERDLAGGVLGLLDSTQTGADRIVHQVGGRGLNFDGSDDWIDFGDNVDLGTSDFTVALLGVGKTGLAGGRFIQKRGTGSAGNVPGWQMVFTKLSDRVQIVNTILDDGAGNVVSLGSGDTGIAIDTLALFSIERVGSTTLRVRANGKFIVEGTDVNLTGSVDNARKLTIGASDVNATQYADFEVYGAWIWNYALGGTALRELSQDPFAMFRRRRRVFLGVEGAPGGGMLFRHSGMQGFATRPEMAGGLVA